MEKKITSKTSKIDFSRKFSNGKKIPLPSRSVLNPREFFQKLTIFLFDKKKRNFVLLIFLISLFFSRKTRIRKKFSWPPKKETKNNRAYLINVLFSRSFTDNTFTSFRTQTFIGIDKFSWPDEFDKFPPRRDIQYSFSNYWCTVIPDRKFRI